jgi:hypothetical protein
MDRHPAIAEYTDVALARPVQEDGQLIPEGARGVVVAAYADGLAYEVEFERPFHAVVTLEQADIRVVTDPVAGSVA